MGDATPVLTWRNKPRRGTPEDRFFRKVAIGPNGCWDWIGYTSRAGYGCFNWGIAAGSKTGPAHRWSYEFLRDEIPDGLTLDHLCRNTRCVNPWHLDPCPREVNAARGFNPSAVNARKTRCDKGHDFTVENTRFEGGSGRRCKQCKNDNARRRYHSAKSAAATN